MRDLSCADGMSVVARLGADLSHVEFRLLILLSDCPSGRQFFSTYESLLSRGRLVRQDVYEAVDRLKFMRDGPGEIFKSADGVHWRPRHA